MGKDQELLQAVKTEDLLTVQKLLQRPGKAKLTVPGLRASASDQFVGAGAADSGRRAEHRKALGLNAVWRMYPPPPGLL
ncbi:unnamed protein product [Pleuronectes platessa]|uniref:Uncharacterized protein n=1 Tax=Pleuronectes platessa TaxID=8262 RepID=A0A9N7TJY4_PLEPL|nr:unnamed protein product [Pleuronectes platessa]